MRGLSLKFHIMVLGVGCIALVGFMAFASISLLNQQISSYQNLMDEDIRSALLADKTALNFKRQVQEWKNVLLRGHKSSDLNKYWARFEEHQRAIQKMADELLSLPLDDTARRQVQKFKTSHAAAYVKYVQGKQTFVESGFDSKLGDNVVRGIDREPTKLLEEVSKHLVEQANLRGHQLSLTSAQVSNWVVMLIIAVMGAAIAMSYYVSAHRITRPIRSMVNAIRELAEGNFMREIDVHESNEMGQMGDAVKTLQIKLRASTESMFSVMSELKVTDTSLSGVSSNIREGTKSQHSRTDQAASAMTELSSTAREVAQHASDAKDASDNAERAALNGEKVMGEAISTMHRMKEHISETANVISDLEKNTSAVGKVLDVIRGIAEQTNLLALNAAIEAARAGAQGRGFAVVADEVRTLAQKTAESTAEIHQIIENVQMGAQESVSAIEAGVSQSEDSMQRLNDAGQSLSDIRKCVDDISAINQLIASAAQEQAYVSEDITKAISEIADVASISAEQADEVMGSAGQMRDICQNLESVVNQLRMA